MYNVLIVDDEPDICLGLCEIINWNKLGFKVLDTATDGEDALEKINNQKYDLLITDIRMPVISGLELIKKIREKNSALKIIILSGYNDFNFAKKAIESSVNGYLLKPIDRDELSEYLVVIKEELDIELEAHVFAWNNINIAKDRLLLDLVTGITVTSDLKNKMNSFNINFKNSFYNVAILEIFNLSAMLEMDFVNANLTIFSVRNITEEIIINNNVGYVYEDTNGTIGIVFNGDLESLNDTKIIQYLDNIRTNILKYLKLNVTIGFGQTVNDIVQLKLSHKQAKQALELRSITDENSILSYNTLYAHDSNLFNIAWSIDNLLNSIGQLNHQEIMKEIQLLIDELSTKKFSINVTKIIFYNILFDIANLPRKYNINDNSFFIEQEIIDFTKNSKFFTIKQLQELLISICLKTCKYIVEFQTSKRSNIIDKVQNYIGLHYSEDLTLKSISSIFYMNPVYLGRLFKSQIGDSFNDYVNKIRISEAKKMLLMDSSNIGSIIEKLGFNNQEYFYRLFPKYEGITFAEYKKNLQRNKSTKN